MEEEKKFQMDIDSLIAWIPVQNIIKLFPITIPLASASSVVAEWNIENGTLAAEPISVSTTHL